MSLNDVNRLTHKKWNSKYHIVFAPKYRRTIIYKELRQNVIEIIRNCVRR